MDRDTAVSQIKEHLGFRTDTARDNAIITRMQQAQRLLEKGRSLPEFLLQESQTLAVTSGSAEISHPTRFLREKEGETFNFLSVADDEQVFLEKLTLNEGISIYQDADAGEPAAYTIRKSTFKFYPNRDTAYNLTYSYYQGGVLLTSNVENAWLANAPDVLIGATGRIIAAALRDQGAIAFFTELERVGWASMFADDQMRIDENDPIFMGGRI